MSTSSNKSGRSRKRLLILSDGDFVGGAEVNYRFIVPELIRLGIDATLAAPGATALGEYYRRFDVPIDLLPVLAPYRSFRKGGKLSLSNIARSFAALRANAQSVEGILDAIQPSWVLSSSMISHWLLALVAREARSRGIGVVMFLQDIVDRTKVLGSYGRGLDWIASRVGHVITISDAVSATLSQESGVRINRLYNPVPIERPPRRRPLGETLRVGLFARYTSWKGHGDFLKIAAASASEGLEFLSCGNVSADNRKYFDSIVAEAARLQNSHLVKILEFTPDVLAAMADCDVVLHLSRLPEPFGRVLIEANWVGVPVLAYRGGGVDELFEELRLGGELFDNGDWQAIAARLRKFPNGRYSIPDLEALRPRDYAHRFAAVLESVLQ